MDWESKNRINFTFYYLPPGKCLRLLADQITFASQSGFSLPPSERRELEQRGAGWGISAVLAVK